MIRKDAISLNEVEKEILILKAVWDLISEVVNYSIFDLNHNDPYSSIMFETSLDQKYFNIILTDLLSKPDQILGIDRSYLSALAAICENPRFNHQNTIELLKNSVEDFQEWLDKPVNYGCRKLWFPSIGKEVNPQITRYEFIKICGNISKHNFSRLTQQCKLIMKVFKKAGEEISLADALNILEEFYEQFHDDIFNYHSSSIAEFLNNIRWGIYEYLLPEFNASIVYEELHKYHKYSYTIPLDVRNNYAKTLYWNLMNNIRSKPCMPKFQIAESLKIRN